MERKRWRKSLRQVKKTLSIDNSSECKFTLIGAQNALAVMLCPFILIGDVKSSIVSFTADRVWSCESAL